jgi:hypothetical protein
MGKLTIYFQGSLNAEYLWYVIRMALSPQVHCSDSICSILVGLTAVAIWCTISLIIRILTTMKRWSGVYFYAILATSLGISIRQIGVVTIFLSPNCPWLLRRMLVEIGTVAMISGFSTVLVSSSFGVLYSKLWLTFVPRL